MKTIQVLLLSVGAIVLSFTTAFAQTTYKSQFPIKVDTSGAIINSAGTTFATISKDSIIKNHAGERIAFIDRSGNLVDKDGKILGKAAKNGDFHNSSGEVEYTVKPAKTDGNYDVYDKMGKHVLTVPANYKAQAGSIAYMHKKMLIK